VILAETVRTVTPLGVRFWDAVLDRPVGGGLQVSARTLGRPGPARPGVPTPSGVYAFRGLPGLARVELPEGEEDAALEPTVVVAVGAVDRLRRFLPALVLVPAPFRGPAPMLPEPLGSPPDLTPDLGSPPASPPGATSPRIYLFPGPSRRPLGDVAVVRATLVDHGSGDPVAHARVDVAIGATLRAGISDERGNVAVMFPYPLFAGAIAASPPPGTPGVATDTQSWTATVSVRSEPDALHRPNGGDPPTLSSILAQAPAMVWVSEAGPPLPHLDAELRFGRELVLKTQPAHSALLVGGTSP
jgi:hypothetical protein